MRNLSTPEPPPQHNNQQPVWDLVIQDMKERDNDGRRKYGTPLQPHNGRDALVDAYQEALDLAVYLRQEIEEKKPGSKSLIVTLCGSTRFKHAFEVVNQCLTLRGEIVLSCGVFGHSVSIALSEEEKSELDTLHLRKIDMSDYIFVLDVDGYIGKSTAAEIQYAHQQGKPVKYLSSTSDILSFVQSSATEGPDGLFSKYTVTRTKDGRPADTVVFCLDRRDPCALAALLDYARYVNRDNPELASDLANFVRMIIDNPETCDQIKWDKYPEGPDEARIRDAHVLHFL